MTRKNIIKSFAWGHTPTLHSLVSRHSGSRCEGIIGDEYDF